jgi:hypothetical protein
MWSATRAQTPLAAGPLAASLRRSGRTEAASTARRKTSLDLRHRPASGAPVWTSVVHHRPLAHLAPRGARGLLHQR